MGHFQTLPCTNPMLFFPQQPAAHKTIGRGLQTTGIHPHSLEWCSSKFINYSIHKLLQYPLAVGAVLLEG